MMYEPEYDDDTETLTGYAMDHNFRSVFNAMMSLKGLGEHATVKNMVPVAGLSEGTVSKRAREMCRLHVASRHRVSKGNAYFYVYTPNEGPALEEMSRLVAEYDARTGDAGYS